VIRVRGSTSDKDTCLASLYPAVRARIIFWKASTYSAGLRIRLRLYGICLRLQFLRFLSFALDLSLVLLKTFNRWIGRHENS
jgi:hypothetical protein